MINYEVYINASTKESFDEISVFIEIFSTSGHSTGRRKIPKCYLEVSKLKKYFVKQNRTNTITNFKYGAIFYFVKKY